MIASDRVASWNLLGLNFLRSLLTWDVFDNKSTEMRKWVSCHWQRIYNSFQRQINRCWRCVGSLAGDCRNICPPGETSACQLTIDDQTQDLIITPNLENYFYGLIRVNHSDQPLLLHGMDKNLQAQGLREPIEAFVSGPMLYCFLCAAVIMKRWFSTYHKGVRLLFPSSLTLVTLIWMVKTRWLHRDQYQCYTTLTLLLHFGGKKQKINK